jgi:two-component system chemotaxis sensor kinase CheA
MFVHENSIPVEVAAADWRSRIDLFATRLMIDGGGPGTLEELRSLGAEAKLHGAVACVDVVNALIARIKKSRKSGIAYLLKHGLDELQTSFQVAPAADAPSPAVVAAPVSLSEDAELVADFLVEAREHLSKIEGQMLELERDPSDMEVIHAVFRAFHTIKGVAGFLDFTAVQELSHEVETLLDLARNDKLAVDSSVVDIVLESGDCLLMDMAAIEASLNGGGALASCDHRALIEKIRQRAASGSVPVKAEPAAAPAPAPGAVSEELPSAAHVEDLPDSPASMSSVDLPEAGVQAATPAAHEAVTPVAPLHAPPSPGAPIPHAPAPMRENDKRLPETASVRVETAKLDHLMDMVGEMVIAQSLIRHNQVVASATDSRLMGDLSQLARVTAEVQRATMSMRMVPVGPLFQRIERAVRDLSRKAGKLVVVETSGTETGIDKTVAEELSDPLLHMVRNSVDHGIELPEQRVAAGKTPEARIHLSARHQGGQVIIEIIDDGRGLDCEKIRRKAEEQQLISPGAQLTEPEIHQLIFAPGFSTADQISDVSGRGVGMDVVRRNVEKLHGRIETLSKWGEGTTFQLKLPLTLAIIEGLVVEAGSDRYIIPLSAVWEIFRPSADTLFTVEGRDEMVLVRGKLMPVVRLQQRLDLGGPATELSEGLMVVVESENRRFCLLVDDLRGKQEVVIKSLGETFKDVTALSGCAVLDDGKMGLILDIDGVFRGRR